MATVVPRIRIAFPQLLNHGRATVSSAYSSWLVGLSQPAVLASVSSTRYQAQVTQPRSKKANPRNRLASGVSWLEPLIPGTSGVWRMNSFTDSGPPSLPTVLHPGHSASKTFLSPPSARTGGYGSEQIRRLSPTYARVLATRWHADFARASGGIGCDGPGMETAGTVSLFGRVSRIPPQLNVDTDP
jgi:hypothetical protein